MCRGILSRDGRQLLQPPSNLLIYKVMAEREGFEPPIPVKVCLISSQVHSTGLCHLSVFRMSNLGQVFIVTFPHYDANYDVSDVGV
jgi:hypothetical protein